MFLPADIVGQEHIPKNIFLGRLAQLARASGLHPEGREFESLIAHHSYFEDNPT